MSSFPWSIRVDLDGTVSILAADYEVVTSGLPQELAESLVATSNRVQEGFLAQNEEILLLRKDAVTQRRIGIVIGSEIAARMLEEIASNLAQPPKELQGKSEELSTLSTLVRETVHTLLINTSRDIRAVVKNQILEEVQKELQVKKEEN